eukprot:1595853-Prymnesium_polylepis.1
MGEKASSSAASTAAEIPNGLPAISSTRCRSARQWHVAVKAAAAFCTLPPASRTNQMAVTPSAITGATRSLNVSTDSTSALDRRLMTARVVWLLEGAGTTPTIASSGIARVLHLVTTGDPHVDLRATCLRRSVHAS